MAGESFPKPNPARRRKGVDATQKLIGAQGTVRMYAFGVGGKDPNRSWFMIVGAVLAACVGIAVLTGVVILPGVLAIWFARWLMNPPRGVAVADRGVVVTKESAWNAKPTGVITLLPFDPLMTPISTTKTHVQLQLGNEHIWLRKHEHELLLAAMRATTSVAH